VISDEIEVQQAEVAHHLQNILESGEMAKNSNFYVDNIFQCYVVFVLTYC
jgi:hypothetical protein